MEHSTNVSRVSRAGEDLYCYARCSCGWRSENLPTWRDAEGAAQAHADTPPLDPQDLGPWPTGRES